MIKIMADSTCDLSSEIVEHYNIGIAPLKINIGEDSYRDKIDLSADKFFERLPGLKELPTTSMPSPEEYLAIIDEAIEQGYTEFLCICMSSGTSGSYQSAVLAKELFYDLYPQSPIKIHIVDSLSMSHGSGWLILKSAQLLESGYSFEALIDFNESHKKQVKHFLCVEDLKNLIKSGRISNTGAFVGSLLRVKPIMSMKQGKGAIVAKVRGTNKALKYYVDEFVKRKHDGLTNFVIVGYSSSIDIAHQLKERIETQTDFKGIIHLMQMGAVVGTHVGLNGVSLFFMEK
ncbi:fatty acid-binding protein DegV [Jeotgalibaca sp. PTS2502]|uniref:DegV family protein n=1 Tax=Jeotgalibaca sp. PTS2502 TaxID=1903686 RepID=UPI000973AB89|nr:DegV family protein [Jeotgalibaca sp. PTS2502]APZ49934.1 fatty acid-binding protein DegV [Jeotgalibaca sp. PTS2502]